MAETLQTLPGIDVLSGYIVHTIDSLESQIRNNNDVLATACLRLAIDIKRASQAPADTIEFDLLDDELQRYEFHVKTEALKLRRRLDADRAEHDDGLPLTKL